MARCEPSRSVEGNFTRYLQLIVKRVFDIAVSAIALFVLSPVFLLASLAIRLDTRGPIFSVKHVYCYNDQRIQVLRFRSRNHGDVTACGRFLIRTGLDQLPMLINVLSGEMSIVGLHCHLLPPPRLNDQLELSFVTRSFRAGLVSLKDPQAVADGELSRRNADLFYISHWSLLLDVKVLFQHFFSKHAYLQN
jgi:lipopolysaccharide/colanic/teichoic acid biosynthesis glycosyltransferase